MLVVLSLLAWMPAPASGGAKLFAWAADPVAARRHAAGVTLVDRAAPTSPTRITNGAGDRASVAAWARRGVGRYSVLVGYGLATVIGKQLE